MPCASTCETRGRNPAQLVDGPRIFTGPDVVCKVYVSGPEREAAQ